jgi:DNA polymerase-3 subunit beta
MSNPTCTVASAELLTAFKLVGPAVAGKSTLPVLSCVLFAFDAAEQTLTLTTTNLECAIVRSMPAKGDESFSICLPWDWAKTVKAKHLGTHVDIAFDARTQRCCIISKGSEWVDGIEADEFPVIKAAPAKATRIDVPDDVMQAIVTAAQFTTTDGTRPVLETVLLQFQPPVINVVAADGFRMHIVRFPFAHGLRTDLLIPRWSIWTQKSAGPLARLVQNLDVEAWPLAWGTTGQLHIEFPRTRFVTRLAEGRYPDFERIVPRAESGVRGIFSRTVFLEALEQLLPTAQANANVVRFEVVEPNLCRLWVQDSSDKTKVVSETQLVPHAAVHVERSKRFADENAPLTWAGNINFWLQALRAFDSELVSFAYQNSMCAAVFEPVSDEQASTHILMPMTVRNDDPIRRAIMSR